MVSVVIPTRNRQAFLKEALESISAQDYPIRETIVVDDSSEDGTFEWLSSHSNPKLRAFRLPRHSERSAARNFGMQKALGRFVLFLDDDDLLAPGGLSYLCSALTENRDAIAAIGARECFNELGHRWRSPHPHWRFSKCLWSDVLFGWAPGCGQTLFRKDSLLQVGGWNPRLSVAEDHELWIRLSEQGRAVILPRVVLNVRLHGGQTSFAGFGNSKISQIKLGLIDQLDPRKQVRGKRLHDAYRYLRAGQKAFRLGHYRSSLDCHVYAARRAPCQIWSPLTGPSLMAGLIKSAVCLVQPSAMTALIRRLKRAWQSARGRAPQLPVISDGGPGVAR